MDIESLRRIRNKNVAQQNELTYLEMKQCADSIADYPWVINLLKEYGQLTSTGILIGLSSVPDQEGMYWYGSWLSGGKQFFEFEVLTNSEETRVIELESWKEVFPEVNAHKKGIGKTPAYLALELLVEYL